MSIELDDFTYVGIGASAGGLEALKELVSLLPNDGDNVYFIAQHFDPNKKSTLAEILSKYTKLSVKYLSQKSHFQAKTIYVIPAGYDLTFKNERLVLEKIQRVKYHPTPSVDRLFESLALYKGEKSIAIVLTGSGHDGREGIQKIKEHNGVTIAQDPEEAYCKSMPQSAIDAGYVDYVLPIKEIAHNFSITTSPSPLVFITNLLKREKNFDIEKYKSETVLRRIDKRVFAVHAQGLQEYVEYIQSHKEEIELLFQNFLIGVTEFFRDKESYSALEKELYAYLKEKPQNYELKIWSIACSTGEEAYSLAILVDKVSKSLHKTFRVKIFATDIDAKALARAREAIYPKESLKNVDAELRDAYFTQVEQGYSVIKRIRSNIIFTQHNILNDPPFINQDIVSCRNFLIYIVQEVQEELFALLHYALKENGLLFLGSSESTLIDMKYFETVDTTHKIYKKETLAKPPKISPQYFRKYLDNKETPVQTKQSQKMNKSEIEEEIKNSIFDYLAPNCVVIDKEFSIVYKKGDMPYLHMPDGFITLNILENLNKSLKYEVKKIISYAFEKQQQQATNFIQIHLTEESLYVRVIVYPYKVNTSAKVKMLILYFQELHPNELVYDTQNLNIPDAKAVLESLNRQLSDVKDENHTLEQELLFQKENLQEVNEELQSSNEELQSSNEELETSNEELQSSNEELQTSLMNEKILQDKLSSILNASQDAIIGLDLDGNHTFVNDATIEILGYSRKELLNHNAHKIWHYTKPDGSPYPQKECTLHNSLQDALSIRTKDLFWKKDGTSIEVEVVQDPLYLNGKVAGAVLSFHDITEHERLKKELQHEHTMTELYLNIIEDTLLMTLDLDGNITMINRGGAKILGSSTTQLIGQNWFDTFLPKEIVPEVKKVFKSVVSDDMTLTRNYKSPIIDLQGQTHQIFWTNAYTKDADGNITGVISSGSDITKEEELSRKLFNQEQLYKLIFEEANIGIAYASLDEKWIKVNHYLTNLLGYTQEEFQTKSISELTYEEERESDKQMRQELLDGKRDYFNIEKRFIHKDGSLIWVDLSTVLLKDKENNPLYFVKVIRDISKIKLLMYELEAEKRKFKTIVDVSPVPFILYDENGKILLVNNKFEDSIGYKESEVSTINTLVRKLYKNLDNQKLTQIKDYYKNPQSQHDVKQIITKRSGDEMIGIFNAVRLNDTDTQAKKMYLVVILDITELEKKDELMIAQSRQAAMGEMLSMIAHQWRQPLSVISMLGNNLQLELELHEEINEEEIRHLINTLSDQTKYLSQTIEDFREFFKPDKEKDSITADAIVEKLKTMMLKSLENNNITLEVVGTKGIKITTYVNQLVQVLLSLLSNAKDAIKSNNSTDGLIKIEFTQEKDMILLSVCDNGGGIDKSILKKLGEPYVSTKSKNGTGLGLYMSIKIVEEHLDGTLTWKSSVKGSCFTVSLPKS